MTEQLRGHVFPNWGPRGPFPRLLVAAGFGDPALCS